MIDLYGNFSNSSLIVSGNNIHNLLDYIEGEYDNLYLTHCGNLLKDYLGELPWFIHDQKTFIGDKLNYYYQLNHVVSIR